MQPALVSYRLALPLGSLLLAILFTALEPETTASMPVPAALLFWLAHVGSGVGTAVLAAVVMGRAPGLARLPLWGGVLLSGVLGALLFAPLAYGLEQWWPLAGGEDAAIDAIAVASSVAVPAAPALDTLDRWEAGGGLRAVFAEFLQLLPEYLSGWVLINAAPMLAAVRTPRMEVAAPLASLPVMEPATVRLAAPFAVPAPLSTTPVLAVHASDARASDTANPFLARLPRALGEDLIAIRADLHYLEVSTTRGRITLLAGMREAEAALGDLGLRIHRSYWVAHRHVRRLVHTPHGWRCELSDGSRLPVSRRRVRGVREWVGVRGSQLPAP